MRLIKMSYKGFAFNVNPSTLKVKMSKPIHTKAMPFSYSRSREQAHNPTVIAGSGSFVGKDARNEAYQLARRYKQKGSDYLFAPNADPIKMYFNSLNIIYTSDKDRIDYEFEFTEDCNGRSAIMDFGYTYARNGENLYDIANRTGVAVDDVFEHNSYPDLFSVEEGDKVWLS